VIYDLVDEVRAIMEGKLAPTEERAAIGQAEVRAVFGTGSRIVAGVMVNDGLIRSGCHAVVRPPAPSFLSMTDCLSVCPSCFGEALCCAPDGCTC
jgi:hypothetical protein